MMTCRTDGCITRFNSQCYYLDVRHLPEELEGVRFWLMPVLTEGCIMMTTDLPFITHEDLSSGTLKWRPGIRVEPDSRIRIKDGRARFQIGQGFEMDTFADLMLLDKRRDVGVQWCCTPGDGVFATVDVSRLILLG